MPFWLVTNPFQRIVFAHRRFFMVTNRSKRMTHTLVALFLKASFIRLGALVTTRAVHLLFLIRLRRIVTTGWNSFDSAPSVRGVS